MLELISIVFGLCFIGISFIVFLVCILFGHKDDTQQFEERLRMDRFMKKYNEYESAKEKVG
jgi:hypothetical protein